MVKWPSCLKLLHYQPLHELGSPVTGFENEETHYDQLCTLEQRLLWTLLCGIFDDLAADQAKLAIAAFPKTPLAVDAKTT